MGVKETYLTVKQLAEIKGCTERYIQSCVNKGKIIAEVTIGKVGGNAGTHYSMEYRIPLSKLDEKVQLKYKRYLKKQQKEVEKQVQEQETEEQQNNSRFDRKRETKCDVLA